MFEVPQPDWTGYVADALQALATEVGVDGCALVDMQSGMVLHAVGADIYDEQMWEAGLSYWRQHERQADIFAMLGPIGGIVLHHPGGMVVIFPLREPGLLAVAVGQQKQVDWITWQRRLASLSEAFSP